jgi:iron complex transport system ATP-binding protein
MAPTSNRSEAATLSGDAVARPAAPLLCAHDLAVGYSRPARPRTVVAERLQLGVDAGEIVCLLGANGVGKSTLLRTLAATQPPLAGSVTIAGANVHRLHPRELARHLALVLTDRVAVGSMTAYSLVALGRHPYTDWAGRLGASDHVAVKQAMTTVGARHLAGRQVDELSDGERQKVMIARALAQETPLLILDEITAFLDLPRRIEIMALLHDLAHLERKAVLVSTHDLDLALRTADWIWLMSGDGRLDIGTPEEVAMNGALARAFQSEAVVFDAHTGHFRAARKRGLRIGLEGDGSVARWTAHALERCGFEICMTDSTHVPIVRVVDDETPPRWVLTLGDVQAEHFSIRDLTSALGEQLRPE